MLHYWFGRDFKKTLWPYRNQPMTANAHDFVSFLADQLQDMGTVVPKRMFSGYGLFCDGLMFAIYSRETLFLKTSPQTVQHFTERGLQPFAYLRQGRTCTLSYYEAPSEILDNKLFLCQWCLLAFNAAQAVAGQRKGGRRQRRPARKSKPR